MFHLRSTASSECTYNLFARYLAGASGRGQLSGKFRILDFYCEARFEFSVAEFHDELEADLAVFEIDLLDGQGSVEPAHVRVDSQPLLACASLG